LAAQVFGNEPSPPDPTAFTARVLQRLPVERVERLLRGTRTARMIEAAVGATLVSYQYRQSSGRSPVAQLGIQAIRFAGSDWLERSRFRVTPEIRERGFAISVKTRN
jgi:hypothetical protein